MLTQGSIPQLKSLLFSAQGITWSYQRKLALASQLIMLVLGMIILMNVMVNLGERRLQNDWATQRYGDLQTLGTLLSDNVSFQEFRTRTFAQSEPLNHYFESPTKAQKHKLLKLWSDLTKNIPDLLEVAIFDEKGNISFSSSPNQFLLRLPEEVVKNKGAYSGENVYTSEIKFAPIKGILEPYWYQASWVENPKSGKQGFVVIFTSLNQTIQKIKPDIGMYNSVFSILGAHGTIYTGSDFNKLKPEQVQVGVGGSFAQAFPDVWRDIVLTKFGQFHTSDATFVFLNIDLNSQDNIGANDYYLVSFELDKDIVSRFTHWKKLMLAVGIVITLLASLLIIIVHLYKLEKRARGYNIELVDCLFNDDHGVLIANEKGRIVAANKAAAEILNITKDKLIERTLSRIFHLEIDEYQKLINDYSENGTWAGQIDLRQFGAGVIDISMKSAPDTQFLEQDFVIVNLNDVSQLIHTQERKNLLKKLADSAVPVALVDNRGSLIHVNNQFDNFLRLGGRLDKTLIELFGSEIEPQWNQIQQQISLKGSWQGHLSMLADGSSINVDILLNNYTAADTDNEHLICTLLPVKHSQGANNREVIPFRSAILVSYSDVERYFKKLDANKRLHSSMMLMEITPEGVFSHISDRGKLEKRQQDIEMRLLLELPKAYQLAQWQLGKLMLILPNTSADEAHQFALDMMKKLEEHGLADGVCVGLVVYHEGQTFSQFMDNAEVALKRAKHNGEHNICQAYTRPSNKLESVDG